LASTYPRSYGNLTPFVEVHSPFFGMNMFHVKIDLGTPHDTWNPQPGCDIKEYAL
jgi:hypothetical protein